jgi:hypothetical protein
MMLDLLNHEHPELHDNEFIKLLEMPLNKFERNNYPFK